MFSHARRKSSRVSLCFKLILAMLEWKSNYATRVVQSCSITACPVVLHKAMSTIQGHFNRALSSCPVVLLHELYLGSMKTCLVMLLHGKKIITKDISSYANKDFILVLSSRASIMPIMPFVKSSLYINCA